MAGSACFTEPAAKPVLVGETGAFAAAAGFPEDAWAFAVTLAGADATDDTTAPTAWIAGLAAAASPAVAEATPEPLVSTWVVPFSAVPAAATVAVTARAGFWPA